ncbi:MAG: GIY-YIG nuclease family protein [Patescibacteria group bacterium]
MYIVYILQSVKTARYYIGHCEDLSVRLKKHNAGKVRSTKSGRPWKVVRTKKYPARAETYRRERQIKSYKGGKAFKSPLTATASSGVSAGASINQAASRLRRFSRPFIR